MRSWHLSHWFRSDMSSNTEKRLQEFTLMLSYRSYSSYWSQRQFKSSNLLFWLKKGKLGHCITCSTYSSLLTFQHTPITNSCISKLDYFPLPPIKKQFIQISELIPIQGKKQKNWCNNLYHPIGVVIWPIIKKKKIQKIQENPQTDWPKSWIHPSHRYIDKI